MKTILLLLVVATLIPSAGPGLRTVEKGDQSNFDEGKQVIVRTPGEWNALWHAHSPDRPQPRVDLSRDMIVAVFLGSRNTAGYAVTIESVQADQGTVVVHYRQTDPPRDAITAQVITSPYHIVAVPKAAGAARFERVQ